MPHFLKRRVNVSYSTCIPTEYSFTDFFQAMKDSLDQQKDTWIYLKIVTLEPPSHFIPLSGVIKKNTRFELSTVMQLFLD